jgi:hypothetical protein
MKQFQLVLAALLACSPLAWTKPAARPSPFGEVKSDAKKATKDRARTMLGEKANPNNACRSKDELVRRIVIPDAVSVPGTRRGIIARRQ